MKSTIHWCKAAWLVAATIASLLLAAGEPASAATGLRVVRQTWSPLAPDQQGAETVFNHPSLVSDSIQQAWQDQRDKICSQLKGHLGVGGVAKGQTLSDITCLLDEQPTIAISRAADALVVMLEVGGYLEATSTTPTVFGSYADPRFSVAFSARLKLVVAVQADPNRTLRVSQVQFSIANAQLDSHNVSADVIAFVLEELVPFFGGPDFKRVAENAINSVSISGELVDRFDAALAPVNARLTAPPGLMRAGWEANADRISIAYAPPEMTPPRNGSLRGTIRWNGAEFSPRRGCGSFDVHATVQTGPVPMFRANAEAPRREIGTFQASSAGATACGFTITGLAAGWPTVVGARVVDGSAAKTGNALYSVSFDLQGQGWDGVNVVPQALTDNRDYEVARSLGATATEVGDYSSARAVVKARTDPRINPADRYASQAQPAGAAVIAGRSELPSRTVQPSAAVTLNPQPLPPGPGPDPIPPDRRLQAKSRSTQSLPGSAGIDAGIIIVSGRNGDAVSSVSDRDPLRASIPVAAAGTSLPASTRSATAVDVDALAARGADLTRQDPLAGELRAQQTAAGRRGFDIGMAAAEGQTAPGPGKQAIHDALPPAQQAGFTAAVAFSLERNRNAARAALGARIAAQDDVVAEARNEQADAFYRLGFDIATAIFGDPALGAQGNTAAGPGSLGIRDSLDADAQSGFNAAMSLHLSRDYPH